MTNRRQFLRTGVSMSALPLTVQSLFSPNAAFAHIESSSVTIYKAIFDDRYSETRSCAEVMSRIGIPTRTLNEGHVTDLWYDERKLLLRERRAAVVGMTQFGPMLVFEQLGREHRMRLALRVEHQARDDGTIAHAMRGPAQTIAFARNLQKHAVDWPLLMAAVLTYCCTDNSSPVDYTIVTSGRVPVLRDAPVLPTSEAPESVIHYYTPHSIREGDGISWDGPLYSWAFAPVEQTKR
jgi:hypothetical protein